MNRGLINSLTETEQLFLAETERENLRGLSEDELMELHTRARRARSKYVTMYRREAATKVKASGGRGMARPVNSRNRDRAEVFEDALARVSQQLAVEARKSAKELRDARLDEAREAKGQAPATRTTTRTRAAASPSGGRTAVPNVRRGERATKSPTSIKTSASTGAATARKQAKKDSR